VESRIDMDDDDFMGEIEFDLTPEQKKIVAYAITLASSSGNDEFRQMNPLISILQWWEANVAEDERPKGTPEATLAEACRQFVLSHEKS
jgi:hypothetical protein